MLNSITTQLIEKLAEIDQAFKDIKPENFTFPPNVKMGDLSLPVFELAKENPAEFAAKMAGKLGSNEVWEQVEATGPYINFYLKAEVWAKELIEGSPQPGKVGETQFPLGKGSRLRPEKVMIEYSQPNTHKEFHVGHLRNACLGAAIVNLNKYIGDKVIAATYVNDVGLHVAKCLWAYLKFHKDEEPKENKTNFLGKIYTEAVKKLDQDEKLKDEIDDILIKLEKKDKEIMKIWKKTQKWSIEDFERIYGLMGIQFDAWYFESDVLNKGRKIVSQLIRQGIAKEDQGAIIVDLKKYDLDVLLILKSDGTTLYSTSDLVNLYI